jgi:hypothetical protein
VLHIPRSRICVTPNAPFGFHLAKLEAATRTLWNVYQPDIRAWINQRGVAHECIHLDACARHVSLYQEVLSGSTPQGREIKRLLPMPAYADIWAS